MSAAMATIENPLTHRHGYLGCFLPPGVDPTAPPIQLPPGVVPGVAVAPPIVPFAPFTPPASPVLSFLGLVVVALAYFAIGVAVGAQVRRLTRWRTGVLLLLIVPGTLGGLGFLVWVVLSLV